MLWSPFRKASRDKRALRREGEEGIGTRDCWEGEVGGGGEEGKVRVKGRRVKELETEVVYRRKMIIERNIIGGSIGRFARRGAKNVKQLKGPLLKHVPNDK